MTTSSGRGDSASGRVRALAMAYGIAEGARRCRPVYPDRQGTGWLAGVVVGGLVMWLLFAQTDMPLSVTPFFAGFGLVASYFVGPAVNARRRLLRAN